MSLDLRNLDLGSVIFRGNRDDFSMHMHAKEWIVTHSLSFPKVHVYDVLNEQRSVIEIDPGIIPVGFAKEKLALMGESHVHLYTSEYAVKYPYNEALPGSESYLYADPYNGTIARIDRLQKKIHVLKPDGDHLHLDLDCNDYGTDTISVHFTKERAISVVFGALALASLTSYSLSRANEIGLRWFVKLNKIAFDEENIALFENGEGKGHVLDPVSLRTKCLFDPHAKTLQNLQLHDQKIYALANDRLQIFDMKTGKLWKTLEPMKQADEAELTFCNYYMASFIKEKVTLWNLENGKKLVELEAKGVVLRVVFKVDQDLAYVAAELHSRHIQLWRTESRQFVNPILRTYLTNEALFNVLMNNLSDDVFYCTKILKQNFALRNYAIDDSFTRLLGNFWRVFGEERVASFVISALLQFFPTASDSDMLDKAFDAIWAFLWQKPQELDILQVRRCVKAFSIALQGTKLGIRERFLSSAKRRFVELARVHASSCADKCGIDVAPLIMNSNDVIGFDELIKSKLKPLQNPQITNEHLLNYRELMASYLNLYAHFIFASPEIFLKLSKDIKASGSLKSWNLFLDPKVNNSKEFIAHIGKCRATASKGDWSSLWKAN